MIDGCHIWLARPEQFQARDADILDASERARRQRFVFERDQQLFLAAHALLRVTLSRYRPEVEPRDWEFETLEHGRPEITGPIPRALRFNISHTHGLVALVVTEQVDCGIDVEDSRRTQDPERLADRYFAASEVAALMGLPREHRRRRFFTYWTLKEAYIKAVGRGLAVGLARFAFDVERESTASIAFDDGLDDHPGHWQFVREAPTEHHMLGVALRWGDPAPRPHPIRWYQRPT